MPLDAAGPPPPWPELPEEVASGLGEAGRRWLSALLRRLEAAEERAARLERELGLARERIALLEEENRLLKEENRRLRARLGKDSSNSSRPPSSDGPGSKARKRRKQGRKGKRSGRKAGGQRGHQGTTRTLHPVEEADQVIDHFPRTCAACGESLEGAEEAGRPLPHQQYELPPLRLEVLHHWLHRLVCPRCGAVTTAELNPGEASGQGPRLTAFIGLLTAQHRLSRSLVSRLLGELFGVRISPGTVQACWERVGEALVEPVEELEGALQWAEAVHLDETSWQEGGKRRWLWVATTPGWTLFTIHPRRGKDVLRQWFPEGFEGTVVSDRWSAYGLFDIEQRQLCWSHLGRDLQAIIDAGGAGAERAAAMRKGEAAMFRAWRQLQEGRLDREGFRERVQPFRVAFEAFCKEGAEQAEDELWRRLGRDLLKKWPAVFRFVDHEGIEPTNNPAERAVRAGVILRKLSQGTRSETGSRTLARALSVIATCRQQGRDVLEYLGEALRCHWRGIPPPPLLATAS